MGNGMNKIIPGLYVGNFRDSKDPEQLKANGITHILSAHDNARELLPSMRYLCIRISDAPNENIAKHFAAANEFIHRARRVENGAVCVHCLAGVSRSVTLATVYIMTACDLSWRDALNAIRGARRVANPNIGFQRQLAEFERSGIEAERERLRALFGDAPLDPDGADRRECLRWLKEFTALQESVGDSVSLYTDYTVNYKDYRSLVNSDRFGPQSAAPRVAQAAAEPPAEARVNGAQAERVTRDETMLVKPVTVQLDDATRGDLPTAPWLDLNDAKAPEAAAKSAAETEAEADSRVVATEVERLIRVHREAMSSGGATDSSPVLNCLTQAANSQSDEAATTQAQVVLVGNADAQAARNYETVPNADAITVIQSEEPHANANVVLKSSQ